MGGEHFLRMLVSSVSVSWNCRPPVATFWIEGQFGTVAVIRGFGGPVGPFVFDSPPVRMHLTSPRLLIHLQSSPPCLSKQVKRVLRHLPQGGELFGVAPSPLRSCKLDSSPPSYGGVPLNSSPSRPNPSFGGKCVFVLWPEKTQETHVYRPIPSRSASNAINSCDGLSPPRS